MQNWVSKSFSPPRQMCPWRFKILDLVAGVGGGALSACQVSLGACTLQRAKAGLRAGGPSPSKGSFGFHFDVLYPGSDHCTSTPSCRTSP